MGTTTIRISPDMVAALVLPGLDVRDVYALSPDGGSIMLNVTCSALPDADECRINFGKHNGVPYVQSIEPVEYPRAKITREGE